MGGAEEGETDGGLTVLGNEGATFVLTAGGHTYTGPTVIAGSAQVRVNNAFPVDSPLILSNGYAIVFNTYDNKGTYGSGTAQTLKRIGGNGTIDARGSFVVQDAVAPAIGGHVELKYACSLSGDLEIAGDATGCGYLQVADGQDISGLSVKMIDEEKFDHEVKSGFYKILQGNYAGTFKPSVLPRSWFVRYDSGAAYLVYQRGTCVIFR